MTDHKQYGWDTTPAQGEQDFTSAPNITRTDKDFSVKEFYVFNNIESINKKGRKIGLTVVGGGVASIYTALLTDLLIGIQDVKISRSVVLPKASLAGLGKVYFIKDISGSALSTSIAINTTGTDTINGDTSTQIAANYGFFSLFTDGSNWFVQ